MKINIPLSEYKQFSLKQRFILGIIQGLSDDEGVARVTNFEIAGYLGVKNPNDASTEISELVQKGIITRDVTVTINRSMILTDKGEELMKNTVEVDTDWWLTKGIARNKALVLGYILKKRVEAEKHGLTLEEHMGYISRLGLSRELGVSETYVKTSIMYLADIGCIGLISDKTPRGFKQKVEWVEVK